LTIWPNTSTYNQIFFPFFAVTVKYSIEKNLLSDVALAIHSGISVEEILADLIGKGK